MRFGWRWALDRVPFVKLVARVAVLPVIVGIAVGLLTLAVLVLALKAFLFETAPFDPRCWVGAVTLLLALGAGAAWWPSRMALTTASTRCGGVLKPKGIGSPMLR